MHLEHVGALVQNRHFLAEINLDFLDQGLSISAREQMRNTPSLLWTPARYFAAILLIIFVAEACVMSMLPWILPENIDSRIEVLCDASLLTAFTAPIFWTLLIKPLRHLASDQSKKCTAIVEGSRDGILLLNSDGCIESANASVLMGFGTSLREVQGKPLTALIPCLGNDSSPEAILKDLVQSTNDTMEEKCVSMEINGALRHFEIRANTLDVQATRKYTVMIRDATDRRQVQLNLEEANKQLLEIAHRAGKAEVAKCVIHNVGNVLNNMNVLASAMENKVRGSRLSGLTRGAELIQTHSDDLTAFLTEDQRGRQLPEYFVELAHCWESDAQDLLSKLNSLTNSLEHANHIVEAQQDSADSVGFVERVSLAKLLHKSLAISAASLDRHAIALETELDDAPVALIDTNRLLQVLVNLITNAKQALCECPVQNRRIKVRLYAHGENRFKIEVCDNGPGIDQDRMSRIFDRGFTTKPNGHGFGLHYSAIAIQQMGGQLEVSSKGQNQGSTFTIDLPLNQEKWVTA